MNVAKIRKKNVLCVVFGVSISKIGMKKLNKKNTKNKTMTILEKNN